MNTTRPTRDLLLLCLLSLTLPAHAAEPSAPSAATRPTTNPARGGRGNRPPLAPGEAAEIATLSAFPAWKPGAGDGNYSIGPDYANCPEMTPRDGVPVGKVESFTMNADESKFYPPTG